MTDTAVRDAMFLGMQDFHFPKSIKSAQILITFAQILSKKNFLENAAASPAPTTLALWFIREIQRGQQQDIYSLP